MAGQSGWSSLLGKDSPLMSASRLRTGRGSRISFVLANDVSVRLDELTEIELESGSRIRLMAGTVYVDSGRNRFTIQPIQIVTQQGTASDIGTQFELRYIDDVLRLRVREGRVLLQREAKQISSTQGDQLSIDPSGQVVWAQIAVDDPDSGRIAGAPQGGQRTFRSLMPCDTSLEFDGPTIPVDDGEEIVAGILPDRAPAQPGAG